MVNFKWTLLIKINKKINGLESIRRTYFKTTAQSNSDSCTLIIVIIIKFKNNNTEILKLKSVFLWITKKQISEHWKKKKGFSRWETDWNNYFLNRLYTPQVSWCTHRYTIIYVVDDNYLKKKIRQKKKN